MKKRVKKHGKDLPRYKAIKQIEKSVKKQFSKYYGIGIDRIVKKIGSDINTRSNR